jgi:hypothetical protein
MRLSRHLLECPVETDQLARLPALVHPRLVDPDHVRHIHVFQLHRGEVEVENELRMPFELAGGVIIAYLAGVG